MERHETVKEVAALAERHKQRRTAIERGMTGDMCAECGSFTMVRAGACLTCINCGSNTGCG